MPRPDPSAPLRPRPGRTRVRAGWAGGGHLPASFPARAAARLRGAAVALLPLLAAGLLPSGAAGQTGPGRSVDPDGLRPGDTVLAAPAARYAASPVHRFVLGGGHRDLWDVPVPVEVLDLDAFAGGLTVEGPGGGNQTRSLRFTGADGRRYAFRSVDKDARRTLPPELRRSAAGAVLQDQISSLFPLSALVVAPLVDAVGVLRADPLLRVMPADPRLGQHADEFAGMLGWMEERPDEAKGGAAGFAGSRRVVGSERLFEILEEEPAVRVDARAFLRARLVDVLVGDWDRHPGQWRWARFPDGPGHVFQPVPRDRDWSLARIDGAFTWVAWMPWPQYLGFGPELGNPFRRTWNGQALDRRLLVELERSAWSEETARVVAALSDPVLAGAVARLPEAYRTRVGADLLADLRARRDALPAFAEAWYEHLAGWVDVHTTDADERARLTRLEDGRLRVEVTVVEEGRAAGARPWRRTFHPDETREVRLDLRGGDDRVVVEGPGPARVRIRVEGGGGDDHLEDRTDGRGVHLYGDAEDDRFRPAPRTRVDTEKWDEPYDPEDRTDRVPARDWGARTLPRMAVSYSPDRGLSVAAGAQRTAYGFRRWPYHSRFLAQGGVASRTGRLVGRLEGDVPVGRTTRLVTTLEARGEEVRHFFGFGNDTPAPPDEGAEAQRRELRLAAALRRPVGAGVEAGVGLGWRRLRDLGNPGTLVEAQAPYGFPDFDQLAVEAEAAWRGRPPETPLQAARSVTVRAAWHPSLLDVEEPFGTLEADASASVALSDGEARVPPVLALRLGGRKVWGRAPYHEAALLGGKETLRGFHAQRFSGDASLHGSLEARFGLGRFLLLLPGDVGVFAFLDAGRVFHPDDRSDDVKTGVGGGVWLSFLETYSARVAVARGELTGLYLSLGLPF